LPHLTKNYNINFYGGEPLLSFRLIKEIVSFLEDKNQELKKKPDYTITTNGSLLTEEILQFLSKYKFHVELSFDGIAQDILRKKGSFKAISPKIGELLNHPDIGLEVNSVFTPASVGYLSKSVKSIMEFDVPNIHVSFSTIETWNQGALLRLKEEMAKVRKIVVGDYKREGTIPVVNFRDMNANGIFYCAAGKDRLAMTTDGEIWGCYLFPDYFKRTGKAEDKERGGWKSADFQKFSFGSLENFIKNHRNIYPRILRNYSKLSMDNFSTSKMECFLCEDLESCAVCPINAAFSGTPLGEVPDHICKIQKIIIREKKKLLSIIKNCMDFHK
jgi:sulfatase maturation enzyme AslB (radical SAM superfamily)